MSSGPGRCQRKILAIISDSGPHSIPALHRELGVKDREQVTRAVLSLARRGLVEITDGLFDLGVTVWRPGASQHYQQPVQFRDGTRGFRVLDGITYRVYTEGEELATAAMV
jgi:hypothetical protein